MSWTCRCGLRNVNANDKCADKKCNVKVDRTVGREIDSYDILLTEIKIWKEYKSIDINMYEYNNYWLKRDNPMTPQEQLFADFFSKHTILVKDMSMLELRAYREQLSLIAKEAKAGIYAADEKERELKKKASDGRPQGFARSVNADENATNAINGIKDRQKRLTKQEKIEAGLIALGIDPSAAAKLMTAGVIKARLNNKTEEEKSAINKATSSIEKEESKEVKPIFNPFAK